MIRVLRAPEKAAIDYVLIWATATDLHGIALATEAMDLLVRACEDNAERIRAALRATHSNDSSVEKIRADDLSGDYAVARNCAPTGDLYFDLIAKLGEKATVESVESEAKGVECVRVRVATPAALYRLNGGTPRPIDRQDAVALKDRLDLNEAD